MNDAASARMYGQTSSAGKVTKGVSRSAGAAMPSVISVTETNRSRWTFTIAFQIACMAAAAITAEKTSGLKTRYPKEAKRKGRGKAYKQTRSFLPAYFARSNHAKVSAG